ncbi:M61 family metallopeptidase [Pseudomonas sp. CGJS7]|uniref:M61 family metallopeptidase n=1 Tax=Pseudomonas sp. CGJS7 TaxID=3109348 RepID=UPI00300AAD59
MLSPSRIAAVLVCLSLASCAADDAAAPSPVARPAKPAVSAPLADPNPSAVPAHAAVDTLSIRFDALSATDGLTVSIDAKGDADGTTVFSNETCCGLGDVQRLVRDVQVRSGGEAIAVEQGPKGWSVRHAPSAPLTISYRLPPSGITTIDSGMLDQVRPIVHEGMFHLIGRSALLLPKGRPQSDWVGLEVDASRVADPRHFASSFGPGNVLRGLVVARRQIAPALYLGGNIALQVRDTATGRIGVAYSGMDEAVDTRDLSEDAYAIVEAERGFFKDDQPWYLVSVHGGRRLNPKIDIGGGTGLTQAFAMFVRSDLDASDMRQREPFRWVLAHEYFHQWNGLTLRVAPKPGSVDKDDVGVYWFSEGVTEFYTMRLLTRAGLQSPQRSLAVLNNKLARYGANGKRGLGAKQAAAVFWSDSDGEQIPYLRGYLAAWYVDLALERATAGRQGLDERLGELVARAKAEPDFRVDNAFLLGYLTAGLPADVGGALRKFVVQGGESVVAADSFAPCLVGRREQVSGRQTLQFQFASGQDEGCFRH